MLTISMPTFDVEAEYLRASVASIVGQTFRAWRLVIANDGGDPGLLADSLDGLLGDPRIEVHHFAENRGRYWCDAWTLERCDTEWWTPHDSDDWSEPHRYETLMAYLAENPEAVAVTSPSIQHKTSGKIVTRSVKPHTRFPVSPTSWPATVYRTDTAKEIGIDGSYRVAYDTFFMSRYFDTHKVGIVAEPLYHVVKRHTSLTGAQETGGRSVYRKRITRQLAARYEAQRPAQITAVACLLTGSGDPQRQGKRWEPDPALVGRLARSVPRLVVIADEVTTKIDENVTWIRLQPPHENPYFSRWLLVYRWLRYNRMRDPVWCVDATDVVMLREPKTEPGKLYVGVNPNTVGANPWLKRTHLHPKSQAFIEAHPDAPTLNCGTVGGDYPTVLAFLRDFTKELPRDGDRTEMGAFIETCWSPKWRDRLEYGPHITTTFKAYRDNGRAVWRHK